MSEIIDLTKTRVMEVKPSMTHDEMVFAYKEKIPIYGFNGGIEVDLSFLSTLVPSKWPGATSSWEDEIYNKTFEEYSITVPSKNQGKVLIKVGAVDSNKNRVNPVDAEEFRRWADFFGINNLLTKSEFYSKALIE